MTGHLDDYYWEVRGSFQETAPRKTAKNTVKHRDGGIGLMVANHHGGGESSVVVTALTCDPVSECVFLYICVDNTKVKSALKSRLLADFTVHSFC